jgi:hypothetical protein
LGHFSNSKAIIVLNCSKTSGKNTVLRWILFLVLELFVFKIINFVTLQLETMILINMSRQIKLIWDFRGPASAKTAEHHEIHLKEYIAIEKLPLNNTGFEVKGEMQAIAFMVVTDEHMIQVRDALKPHRGELHIQE